MGGNETGNGSSSSNKKQKQPRRGPGIAELERLITLRSQRQQQQQQQISPPYNPPVRAALPTQGMGDNETENGSSSSSSNKMQPRRGPGIAELERQIRRQQHQHQQQQMAPPNNNPPLPPYPSNFNNIGIFQQHAQQVPRLLQMPYSSITPSSYPPHSASYAFRHNNIGVGDQSSYVETINSYGNSQSSPILIDNIDEEKERIQATSNLENQPSSAQSNIPRSLPDLNDSQSIDTKKYGSGSAGSSSQNSESSDTTQELDLELRL